MTDLAQLREGMAVFGDVDQFVGTIERLEPDGIVVNGRHVPHDEVERVAVDRVYLRRAAAEVAGAATARPNTPGAGVATARPAAAEVYTPDTQRDEREPAPLLVSAQPGSNPQNSGLLGSTGTTGSSSMASPTPRWEDYRDRYRAAWEARYGEQRPWRDHERAFRYGWEAAMGGQYPDRDFHAAAANLRSGWPAYGSGDGGTHTSVERGSDGGTVAHAWDALKDTVQAGFERAGAEFAGRS